MNAASRAIPRPLAWPSLLLACAALSLVCASARADVFGPISLESRGSLGGGAEQQVEYAHDTAIAGDGRYVAFDGSIGGVAGVWRKDLRTGTLQQVAGGDAELPSISADGQRISFTTNEGASLARITRSLSGAPPQAAPGVREAVNVYVRNMELEPGEAPAFVVASAVNGSQQPLTYESAEPEKYGSVAIGRTAIDAAGNEVAFVTTAVSNLVRAGTPALQVALRDLETNETKLVSQCFFKCEAASEPAVGSVETGQPYGAVYPGLSVAFGSVPPYGEYGTSPPPGASISADGSTVAWIGEDVPQQAQMLSQETRSAHYTEPLWRRMAPGAGTPTERITGGSEPDNPACIASGETSLPIELSATDPCQGPFFVEEEAKAAGIINEAGGVTGEFVPRLSGNGETVAFVSEAPLASLGQNFGREKAGQSSDLYVARMQPGRSRVQALTPLTELAGGSSAGVAAIAPIFDFEISADGSQVAFVTKRTHFVLGSPAYVSAQLGEPGLNELFDVDLANGTLTRVTHGYLGPGEPSEHPHLPRSAGEDPYIDPGDGALSPALSSDGRTIAFSSTASNLAFGDGNSPPIGQSGPLDGSDAFVVERRAFAAVPTQQYVSPPPPLTSEPEWQIGVTAVSERNGSVRLYVRVPGQGSLRARALSAIRRTAVGRAGQTAADRAGQTVANRAGRSGRRDRRGGRRGRAVVATLAVSSASAAVPGEGLQALTLKLAGPFAALASEPGGLSAAVEVTFSARGEPTLRRDIAVSFIRSGRRRSEHAARRSHPRAPGRGR